MVQPDIVVHASNVSGLGATKVVKSLLTALDRNNNSALSMYILPDNGPLKDFMAEKKKVKRYRRILPNSVSRFVECVFSPLLFPKNHQYIILGDLPLYGIKNQILLVHQSNLVHAKVNKNVSKSFSFRINRWLFKRNLKFVHKVIVQSAIMASELSASYPELRGKLEVVAQPAPIDFIKRTKKILKIKNSSSRYHLFYPSAGYPHKNHQFLLKVAEQLNSRADFKVFLTLEDEEFKRFENIEFIENLGKISYNQMFYTYSKFDALLFLSKAESFGLPLLEAMQLEMPIVSIDLNYARWMCDEKAFYFEQDNISSFLKAIQRSKEHKSINYSRQLQKFPKTWDDVAEIFLKHL